MSSQPTIQEILQAEFSPPLDTSLVAAIVADYVSGNDAHKGEELRQLRDVLTNLAAEAEKELIDSDEQSLSAFSQLQITRDDGSSSYDYSTTENSGYSGYTSPSSGSSDSSGQQLFSSPVGFLHALFPQVSLEKLRTTLAAHGALSDDLDIGEVVEELLTGEYIRELEERGLDETESREMGFEAPWELVEKKKKGTVKQKRQNKKGTTIRLVDVRQQQHVRATPSSSRPAAPDPWNQLASVASHLSTLIPSHPPAYFQSIFHSPQYSTPAQALRAAMIQIARQLTKYGDELTEEESPLLFSMFEILTTSPMYTALNVEERDQLLEDALFALRATGGNPDTALDLVQLLVELDTDFSSKEYSWAVYHQQASQPTPKSTIKLPPGPPPTPPPPNIRRSQTHPGPSSSEKPPAAPNAWQTVPVKSTPEGPHPLSGVIRAYNNQLPPPTGKKVRGSGNGFGKGGKGDVGELPLMSKRVQAQKRYWELFEQRRAAMREAGKAWQRGGRNYGGEIAFYFAERARELQRQQQKQQVDAAREMVMRTRVIRPNRESIDLHGTIVSEAVAVCRDYLTEHWTGKPVQIITGRGSHSKNGVGVLGPAIKNALAEDGWIFDTQEGAIVVRGMRAGRI
ncbi:Smr-domain-containing protein [Daedaleopsis nitida]|nr:Smr-domain-containing protein [Daedaleopsis nitida]